MLKRVAIAAVGAYAGLWLAEKFVIPTVNPQSEFMGTLTAAGTIGATIVLLDKVF